jgi:hypothetical protein
MGMIPQLPAVRLPGAALCPLKVRVKTECLGASTPTLAVGRFA